MNLSFETIHFQSFWMFLASFKNYAHTNLQLVGGFNPSENISQNGNLPQIGVKIKNI